jgi:pyruvate,water dikinase
MTMTESTYEPVSLDDPGAQLPERVGAKAAGVAALRSNGFQVPAGYVLPVGLSSLWPAGEPIPNLLATQIASILEELHGPIAVRSSATWEDGATSSHAGATTTVLSVEGIRCDGCRGTTLSR